MKSLPLIFLFVISINVFSQGHFPWENPLLIAESPDGITFNNIRIFQDSAGVPCMVRWKGDTLICAFQWFRMPQMSPTWDRVAVKFSYDNGLNWTQPVPIVVNGLPVNYQRPFDPTLVVVHDSLRIYFSSSDGMPIGGLDSSINTYSAISVDGINYSFEPFPRYDHPTNRVIDPSVVYFGGQWHYISPIGAPQDGAYHCTGLDGVNFNIQNNFSSDAMHNWTGNFSINDLSDLRFYGSGPFIWFNSSADGFFWYGYQNTNLVGGDPSIFRTDANQYIAVYVGQPNATGIQNPGVDFNYPGVSIEVNPENILVKCNGLTEIKFNLYAINGTKISSGIISDNSFISSVGINPGMYFLTLTTKSFTKVFKIIL